MHPNNYGGPGGQGRPVLGKPYMLSANAPEFVPRNFVPQQPQQQPPQQYQNGVGIDPNLVAMYQGQVPMGVPQQQMAHMAHQNSGGGGGGYNNSYSHHGGGGGGGAPRYQDRSSHHHSNSRQSAPKPPSSSSPNIMGQLKEAILVLTKDPGNFDDVMPELTSTLDAAISTEEKLVTMVEEIFRQSVEEANFRYTGARICNYFSHHLSAQFPSGNFRQHLLKRCHEQHNKREDLVKNCDHRYKLVGFSLFMAELLLNLTDYVKVSTSGDYMTVVAKAVTELILSLLSQPADDTLRSTVQIIKLCGGVIEDVEREQNENHETPDVDKIFSIIKECVLVETYIKSLRAQMLSVIELRASNFGRGDSARSQAASTAPPPPSAAPSYKAPAAAPAAAVPAAGQAPGDFNNVAPRNMPADQQYFGDPSQNAGSGGGAPQGQNQFSNFYPNDMYYYSSGDEEWSAQNPDDLMYMYPEAVEGLVEEDPEMTPEVAAAFEEFLSNQQQQQQ